MSMFADLIAAVKSDRKLSLKNWRYRILHWAFGINPSSPEESPLPDALYKHYCPLFHLTNLIVLCLPLVIVLKAIRFVFTALASALNTAQRFMPSRQVVEPTIEQRRASQLASVSYWMFRSRKNRLDDRCLEVFETFLFEYGSRFPDLEAEEVRAAWASVAAKFQTAKERSAADKKKRNEQLAFYVNSSRMIVKGLLYVGYVAAFLAACYAILFWVIPAMFALISWLSSVDFLNVLINVLYLSRNILLGVLLFFGLFKLFSWSGTACIRRFGDYVLPPLEVAKAVMSEVVIAVGKSIVGAMEFISVLYADNCPSIEIVSSEDEIIEGNT